MQLYKKLIEMINRHKKNMNTKVILLKQPTQNSSFYACSQIKEQIRSRFSFDQSNNCQKNNSLAYLSSIIQEDKLFGEDKFYSFCENDYSDQNNNRKHSESFELQNDFFKLLKHKEKDKNLSFLVQNSSKKDKIQRSKTEGIKKIIDQRRLMPINRLKIGTKNIKFSTKNKQQLMKDFNQFVIKKEIGIEMQNQTFERENIVYQKRRTELNKLRKSTLWLNSIQNELKNLQNTSQRKTEVIAKTISPKKLRRELEPKYASYLKRLKSNIPQVDDFDWSKLSKNLFKLKSQ